MDPFDNFGQNLSPGLKITFFQSDILSLIFLSYKLGPFNITPPTPPPNTHTHTHTHTHTYTHICHTLNRWLKITCFLVGQLSPSFPIPYFKIELQHWILILVCSGLSAYCPLLDWIVVKAVLGGVGHPEDTMETKMSIYVLTFLSP